jgi:CRP/FNR family cyclic AMP-dependent transcriptional regulator
VAFPRRLRADAKVELLRKTPLFSNLSKRELRRVATLADEIDLREGKVLIEEGKRGRQFFVLLEGEAEVRRKGRKVATLGPGDFFGEIALVAGTPTTATVKAISPVRTLVVTAASFRTLLDEERDVQLKVLRALAERLAPQSL